MLAFAYDSPLWREELCHLASSLLEEGKVNLHRMRQEIKLTDDERNAVDDGIDALTKLAGRLAAVRAPDGHTRDQLAQLNSSASPG